MSAEEADVTAGDVQLLTGVVEETENVIEPSIGAIAEEDVTESSLQPLPEAIDDLGGNGLSESADNMVHFHSIRHLKDVLITK